MLKLASRALIQGIRLPNTRLSHVATSKVPKVTIPDLFKKQENQEPIVVLTAHDSISARFADMGGVDAILCGDSLAMVAMGYSNTNEITLDDMIYHCRAIRRGAQRPFLIADLPFGSYERGPDQALDSAIRMIKEGHAECLKFEGGRELVPTVEKLTSYGIVTMPHIGLTPQRGIKTGGFKVQGRTADEAFSVLEDAIALKKAGAAMLLLEGVPGRVGEEITRQVSIPVIGIGAGSHTNGQVLVQLDILGGFDDFQPKFVKKYGDLLNYSTSAIRQYSQDVRQRQFPAREHVYTMNRDEHAHFLEAVKKLS